VNIKRKALWAALAAGLAATLTAVILPNVSFAHGAPITPGSRTYLCYKDALSSTGEIKPTNPACNNALAVGGAQPFYDWFGVLRSDGAGRTVGFVPDGALCSGGFTKYAGFDAPRNDWPLTHLTSGASFNFTYAAWAAHPGWFYLYVTKDGFDPNVALTWNDMEATPFYTADHPPLNGSAPDGNYYWTANLPQKTGRHIIYMVWKRSDSNETFYSCSDVVFDGGHGEVTGINNGSPLPSASASPSTSTSPSPSRSTSPSASPSPSRSTSPSASPSPSRSTSPSPSASTGTGACTATYTIVNSWNTGFQADVTVKNNSTTTALNGWTVKWTFNNGQQITQIWSGVLTTSGSAMTVKPMSYNTTIAPSSSTTFGFLANVTGTNTITGLTCTSP
jgi:predicted carbohydrate-binding protein with CBM5 and CBM33 domain